VQSRALRGRKRQDLNKTIFPDVNIDKAVAAIRDKAVHLPVRLPPDVVAELRKIAETAPLEAIS
jgi:hypothetical protein